VWTGILDVSRAWGVMSRDCVKNDLVTRQLINRHIAWAALRYEMRRHRAWESTNSRASAEYQRNCCVPEQEAVLDAELSTFMAADELRSILASRNKAMQLMANQRCAVKDLFQAGDVVINFFIEMEKMIKELLDHQGRSERIKNFPYPRQYAIINTFFIRFLRAAQGSSGSGTRKRVLIGR